MPDTRFRKKIEVPSALSGWEILLLCLLGAATLGVSAVVARHAWDIGVAGQWVWEYYARSADWFVVAPAVMFLILLVGGGMLLWRNPRRVPREWLAFFACMVICLGLVFFMADCGPAGEAETLGAIAMPWIGGYYEESLIIEDMSDYLRDYSDRIAALSIKDIRRGHVADHPAGPVVFHWLVNRFMEAHPHIARTLIPTDASTRRETRQLAEAVAETSLSDGEFAGIWGAAVAYRLLLWLSLVPVYLLARDLYSPAVAFTATGLAALIPSLHLFGPYPDQLFPLLATGAFFAWHRAMVRRHMGWSSLSALLTFTGLLWSLSLLLVVALLAAAAGLKFWSELAARKGPPDWNGWARVVVPWAAVFLLLCLLPGAMFGYDVWRVWGVCLSKHAQFAQLFSRTYAPWVLFNPIEFLVFTGVPCALLMVVEAGKDGWRWWRDRSRTALSILPWALVIALALMDLSGKNLGETARLWMFTMPLAAVSAGNALVGLDRGRGWVAAYVLFLGAVQLVVFRLHLNVLGL